MGKVVSWPGRYSLGLSVSEAHGSCVLESPDEKNRHIFGVDVQEGVR